MLLHCRASDTAQGDSARSNYSSSTTRTCDHDHHTYAAEVAWSSATSQSASVAHCLIHQPFVHPEALHLYLDDIACDHTSAVLLLITATGNATDNRSTHLLCASGDEPTHVRAHPRISTR